MNNQYLFFCVNIGCENLLKEEIKHFYPELTLSYSRKGFLTFKNKGVHYDTKTISQLQATFATRVGICLGNAKPAEVELKIKANLKELGLEISECMIHSFSINTKFTYKIDWSECTSINEYSANEKLVLDLVTLSEKEIWFGLHRVAKGITRYPNSVVQQVSEIKSPSVGFKKLSQVHKLFSLPINPKDKWLDFGCSPGGSSSFLLSKGVKVWGIDTAKVAERVLSKSSFHYIKSSVQDLSQEALPDTEIAWVHVDLNLNPNQAIKEVLRLCKKYNHSLKGIVFTIQIVRMEFVQRIEEFEDTFYEWGFNSMVSRQVPAHKNEYVLIARR